MKIVITGGTGQLGSELKDVFGDQSGHQVTFLDRSDLDLSKPEEISGKLAALNPDAIVHAGAYTAVDLAEGERELADRINHLATREIAEFAKKGSAKLIYISTDYVFPGTVDAALKEDHPTNPINVYGETKRRGELAVLAQVKDAIIIRTSWVYSIYGRNFVKTMLNLMRSRPEINVVADQIGSPTYAYDLAVLIKHIVDRGIWVGGVYHYSNEGRISWYDFAIAIRDLSGLACRVNPVDSSGFPTAAKRPGFSLLDKGKVRSIFGVEVPFWKDSLIQMLSKLDQDQLT